MITRTVRVPEELVIQIDNNIGRQEYSTRADFVLHALREIVLYYADEKTRMIKNDPSITRIDITNTLIGITNDYLQTFTQYEGPLIQINTRVPEGLDKKLDVLINENTGFKNKANLTRAAIIHLTKKLFLVDYAFRDAEELVIKQQSAVEMINKAISKCYVEGKDVNPVLNDVESLLKRNGYL